MMVVHIHSGVSMLAFFQATQLNLFERFLNQAVAGINSTNITSGMQNVAYVVLLVGFLWQVYQSALHGGDVRSLGTSLIKYVVTALIVMNYSAVFSTINQGFVNAGNWISNASGASNLFENWQSDLQTQFNQDGTQKLWELITGDIPALLDGLLIIVAYLLYPFVIAIFGFFYIFYGSILYIFGPIVIALMPLGATNRFAKSYVEHVMIWNAWPILYGGFGALLSAVQMGQIGQMLGSNNFLGGFGNLEGSLLIGIASIIYSLAIAIIPFIAKRIVSGDVGSTAGAMIGAAATALTLGAAAVEGGIAGASAGGASSSGFGGKEPAGSTSTQGAGGRTNAITGGANQPAAPQRTPNQVPLSPTNTPTSDTPATVARTDQASPVNGSVPNAGGGGGGNSAAQGADRGVKGKGMAEDHAAQIRSAFMPGGGKSPSAARTSTGGSKRQGTPVPERGAGTSTSASGGRASSSGGDSSSGRGTSSSRGNSSANRSNAPSARREGLATWGAYHAARLATQGVMSAAQVVSGAGNQVASAIKSPVDSARKMGTQAGRASGAVANVANRTAQTVAHAVSHPVGTARRGAAVANNTVGAVTNAANRATNTARSAVSAVRSGFSSSYEETRRDSQPGSTEDSKD
jgi:hypothetical protein